MIIFLVVVTVALLLKGTVFILARRVHGESRVFLNLILVFAMHNLCELIVLLQLMSADHLVWLLRAYYCVTVIVLAHLCVYAAHVSQQASDSTKGFMYGVGLALCVAILFSNSVVSGVVEMNPLVTAIRGEYYFLFQSAILVGFFYIAHTLVMGAVNSQESLVTNRCLVVLLAMAPLIVMGIIVVGFMVTEAGVNAAGVVPAGTTLFLLIILKFEHSHRLTDIRVVLPFSLENNALLDLKSFFSAYALGELGHREAVAEIEKSMLLYKHTRLNETTMSERALALNLKRPTLYNRYKKLGLEHLIENDKD